MRAALAACLALRAIGIEAAEAPEERVFPSHLMVDQEVTVMARITGIVDEILAERGAVVAKDQPLARLDARELEAEVREAKEEMELRLTLYERAKSLSASQVLSASDLDEKKAQYEVAAARYERVRTLRDYTVIRAPFAGVVTEKYARVGQKVIEDSNEPLFRVTAFEPLLARVYLPEEELLSVRRGDPVEVTLDRFPNARATGTIQFISPSVDPASGMFQVIVHVRRNPSQPELRPGVAVKIRFRSARASQAS